MVIWRTDVVRLLPQTAGFFKLAGINVNLRNLVIEDVRVSTETVNGAPPNVLPASVSNVIVWVASATVCDAAGDVLPVKLVSPA